MFTPSTFVGNIARLGFVLLSVFFLNAFNQTKACDRTSFALDSIVTVTGGYDIYTTLEIGGGIVGSSMGAANNTNSFGFGFFSCQPNFQIDNFPDVLISDTTQVPAFGYNVGSGFFGTQGFIFYQAYGAYTCVQNTAYCGWPHSDVTNIVFRVPVLPDSIQAYGLEGAGNPFVGCYGNSDMVIDFGALAYDCPIAPHQEVDPVAQIPASIRENMPPFLAHGYQPAAAEADGESHVATSVEDAAVAVSLEVFPNPNNGQFRIRAKGLELDSDVVIYSLTGREVARAAVLSGAQSIEMDLLGLAPGMYMAKLEGNAGSIVKRFQVME